MNFTHGMLYRYFIFLSLTQVSVCEPEYLTDNNYMPFYDRVFSYACVFIWVNPPHYLSISASLITR